MKITITLPLPSTKLSPNRQPSTRLAAIIKSKATAKYRGEAKFMASHAMLEAEINPPRWEKATCLLRFYFRRASGRRPDPDNLIGWMKAARDGLTDAGVWTDDRHVRHLDPVIGCDPKDPRVEIEVLEIGE